MCFTVAKKHILEIYTMITKEKKLQITLYMY